MSKLQSDFKTRVAYIQAKVCTLVPSQIRALRLKSDVPRQPDLAQAAAMHQSRISMLETAGANPTLGTLSAIAAALKVGLKVEFVPFSEMLEWENKFSQDRFKVVTLDNDANFLNPQPAVPTMRVTFQRFRVEKHARDRWIHGGTINTNCATGDFSTLAGGNIRVLNQMAVFDQLPNQQEFPSVHTELAESFNNTVPFVSSNLNTTPLQELK